MASNNWKHTFNITVKTELRDLQIQTKVLNVLQNSGYPSANIKQYDVQPLFHQQLVNAIEAIPGVSDLVTSNPVVGTNIASVVLDFLVKNAPSIADLNDDV